MELSWAEVRKRIKSTLERLSFHPRSCKCTDQRTWPRRVSENRSECSTKSKQAVAGDGLHCLPGGSRIYGKWAANIHNGIT